MVLFLTIILCVSALGLLAIIGVKHYELSTGRVLWGSMRPAVGAVLSDALHFVERGVPALLRILIKRLYREARHNLHRGVAWVVLHAERGLELVLHTLRHTTSAPRKGGEASAFLREVSEHKRSLLKESAQSRAIYEE